MKRGKFLKTITGAAAFAGSTGGVLSSFKTVDDHKARFDGINRELPKSIKGINLGVTAYSYSADFRAGTATLERVIADIASMGGTGIEILGEAHVEGYPNPSNKWIDSWYYLLDKYGLKPIAYDIFCDTMLYKDRILKPEELLKLTVRDMEIAKDLGIKTLRAIRPSYPQDGPDDVWAGNYVISSGVLKYYEMCLPYLEKYDLKMAVEMHGPAVIDSKWTQWMLNFIEKSKTTHFGFCPDFSMFFQRPKRGMIEKLVSQGGKKEILEFIASAYEKGLGPDKTQAEVKKMGGGEVEMNWASKGQLFHYSNNNPEDLKIIAPWVYHTHAKFYDIEDDLSRDYSIDYPSVLKAYVKNGITGYLSSECEGIRNDVSISTHLHMQQGMIRKILQGL